MKHANGKDFSASILADTAKNNIQIQFIDI